MGRAGLLAGDNVFFLFSRTHGFVHQCACRTDLNTGRAELTPGLLKGRGKGPDLDQPVFIIHKSDCLNTPEVTAGPDTPCAADTEVIVPHKERMVIKDGKVRGDPFWRGRGYSYIVGHVLELAMPELGAASFIFRDIGGTLTPAAPLLLGAGQAGMPVSREYGYQVFLSLLPDPVIVSDYHHALFDFSRA